MVEVKQYAKKHKIIFLKWIIKVSLASSLMLLSGCDSHEGKRKSLDGKVAAVIQNPLPTPEPRPGFIGDVSPPESSSIPLNVYQINIDEELFHEGVRFEEFGFANSICVAIDTGPVLEDGDSLTNWEDVLNRVNVRANDIQLTNIVYTIWHDILAHTEAQDAEGMGWVVFCWEAELGVGIHEVFVQFSQTSGTTQEYKWYFEITSEEVPLSTATPRPRSERGYNPTINHVPLCNEPSSKASPQVRYRGILPGQTKVGELGSHFDELSNLRWQLQPGTEWWFGKIGDRVNAFIETRSGIVNWINIGGHGFANKITIAEVIEKCKEPDIVFITTLHERRIHLVYLNQGLEVNALLSSNLSLSDEILEVHYFQPSDPDEFWQLNENAFSDYLIEEASWKDFFSSNIDKQPVAHVIVITTALLFIVGIAIWSMRHRQKTF